MITVIQGLAEKLYCPLLVNGVILERVRWPDGCSHVHAANAGGKSGLHGNTVTDNIRRG